MKRFDLLIVAVFAIVGCSDDDARCFRTSDCGPSQFCAGGFCETHLYIPDDGYGGSGPAPGPIVVAPRDAAHSEPTRSPDGTPTFACREAVPGDLHLEEILAAVPSGDAGDANADGERDAYDDEFIEVSNSSPDPVGLRGLELRVNESAKFTFAPEECLGPGEVIVVFSGGAPAPRHRVAHKRFGLGNSGGAVALVTAASEVLDAVTYGADANGSWVRQPSVTGDFVRHADLGPLLFSPGTCPSGAPWDGICEVRPQGDPDAG